MEKLDQLISKFKEVKEELEKNSSPLHDTVEGFMGGLKAMPKGSAERGRFITAHMGHGPFISALNQHPQGKQMHTMLMGHLNSPANAGPNAFGGAKVMAKSEDPLEELEKFYISPYTMFGSSKKKSAAEAPKPAAPAKLTGSDKIKAESQKPIHPTSIVSEDRKRAAAIGAPSNPTAPKAPKLTGLDRIKAESQKPIHAMDSKVKKDEDKDEEDDKDLEKGLFGSPEKKAFTPSFKGHKDALGVGSNTNSSGVTTERSFDPLKQKTAEKKYINVPFGKTINGSYAPAANSSMAMSRDEKLSLNKGGQWDLKKEKQSAAKDEDKGC